MIEFAIGIIIGAIAGASSVVVAVHRKEENHRKIAEAIERHKAHYIE